MGQPQPSRHGRLQCGRGKDHGSDCNRPGGPRLARHASTAVQQGAVQLHGSQAPVQAPIRLCPLSCAVWSNLVSDGWWCGIEERGMRRRTSATLGHCALVQWHGYSNCLIGCRLTDAPGTSYLQVPLRLLAYTGTWTPYQGIASDWPVTTSDRVSGLVVRSLVRWLLCWSMSRIVDRYVPATRLVSTPVCPSENPSPQSPVKCPSGQDPATANAS